LSIDSRRSIARTSATLPDTSGPLGACSNAMKSFEGSPMIRLPLRRVLMLTSPSRSSPRVGLNSGAATSLRWQVGTLCVAFGLRHLGAEMIQREVCVPEGHLDVRVAQDLLKGLEAPAPHAGGKAIAQVVEVPSVRWDRIMNMIGGRLFGV